MSWFELIADQTCFTLNYDLRPFTWGDLWLEQYIIGTHNSNRISHSAVTPLVPFLLKIIALLHVVWISYAADAFQHKEICAAEMLQAGYDNDFPNESLMEIEEQNILGKFLYQLIYHKIIIACYNQN